MMQLRPYQLDCVRHLQANPRAALFVDMGLGKTASTLSALTPDHLPALVVAPKRVAAETWAEEVRRWRPDLTFAHGGTPAKRTAALEGDADIVGLSRDSLAQSLPKLARRYRTVILDESSSFKTRSSARWREMRKFLRRQAVPYRWALTGTPTPSGLMDLWAPLALLDDGERLGTSLGRFRLEHFHSIQFHVPGGGKVTKWTLKPGHDAQIMDAIRDICLSLTGEGLVDLPPTTEVEHWSELPKGARSVYDTVVRDLALDWELIEGATHSAGSPAHRVNLLRQIASGYLYADDPGNPYATVYPDRTERIVEMIDTATRPVIVAYSFKHEAEELRKRLKGRVHGPDTPDLQARWNAGDLPVLLAHPASFGHGLNLQYGGSTLIWASPTWSSEEHQQANRRLSRPGQRDPVTLHYMLASDTVEVQVRDVLSGKITQEAAVMAALKMRKSP